MLIIFIACQFVVLVAGRERDRERARERERAAMIMLMAFAVVLGLCWIVLGHCLVIGRVVKVLHTSTEGDDVDSQFATGNRQLATLATLIA